MKRTAVSFTKTEKLESLEILNYQIRCCENCALSANRKHALPGEGNVESRILILALSPGAKENMANRMFVGPAGQVLDRLFYKAGIRREEIFMTNLIKCMLPGNRKPMAGEIASCAQFLSDEIAIIQPEVLVPLGLYAAKAVLRSEQAYQGQAVQTDRIIFGKLLEINGLKIFPLHHPASLLYNPSYETETAITYQKLKAFL